jgi:hypothetical protein
MNAPWRILMALTTVTLLVQMANSQQRVSVDQNTTFTAPDGAFWFSYPSDFQICKAEKSPHAYNPSYPLAKMMRWSVLFILPSGSRARISGPFRFR